ncbi:MAG: hypothetical protein K0R92_2419 [Lachnospiraceae bacterium]|jgi:two-component system NarL family response regulator|nr:hypothetical protein [Lachnospiraceae bacterium]
MKLKVMLVDDHLLFLEGLRYLLETYSVEVVGSARNGREAFVKAKHLEPDIILLDIRMPECNGLEVLKQLKEELPDTKVIMLTTSEEDEDLFTAMKYGASGYLLKNTDANKLIHYLENISNGEIPLSPGLAIRLMQEFKRNSDTSVYLNKKDNPLKSELTDRQVEVLELVARGATYKEIGCKIGLTERTVKYHISKIMEQLRLNNKAQLISYAAHKGLFGENHPE